MALYIGADPGVNGGVAAVHADGTFHMAFRMPDDENQLFQSLRRMLIEQGPEIYACVEKVWSSPQMGVASAFTFGQAYGSLRMALSAFCVPYDNPTPQTWQKAYGFPRTNKELGDKSRKHLTRAKADEMFGVKGVKITHAIADALLLAEYCRKLHGGR